MMSAIVGAWMTSAVLRYAVGALVLFGGYEAWKLHERRLGAITITQKIEQKADENAKVAETVREAVSSGRHGKPDPYGVRD